MYGFLPLASQLVNPFGHPLQVRTQVLVLQTCIDLRRLASTCESVWPVLYFDTLYLYTTKAYHQNSSDRLASKLFLFTQRWMSIEAWPHTITCHSVSMVTTVARAVERADGVVTLTIRRAVVRVTWTLVNICSLYDIMIINIKIWSVD